LFDLKIRGLQGIETIKSSISQNPQTNSFNQRQTRETVPNKKKQREEVTCFLFHEQSFELEEKFKELFKILNY